jgi:hypothetical protein
LEVREPRHQPGHEEEQRAQAHQGERVGGEDDERVGRDRQDRGHAVDREQHVGERDREQRQHRGARVREAGADPLHDVRALVVILRGAEDPHAGVREQGGERPGDPAEPLQRLGAGDDERAAQEQRREDAVQQQPRLLLPRDRQRREDQREHEHVVEGERLLHHVTGEERLARLGAGEGPQAGAERQREAEPDDAPRRGAADGHRLVGRAHAQVDHDHRGEEGEQAAPDERPRGDVGGARGDGGEVGQRWSPPAGRDDQSKVSPPGAGCRSRALRAVLTGAGRRDTSPLAWRGV